MGYNKNFNRKDLMTLPRLMCAFSIIFGLGLLSSNLIKKHFWEKTTGIVKTVIKRPNESQYYPLVEFKTISGEIVELEIKESRSRSYYEVNDKISISLSRRKF